MTLSERHHHILEVLKRHGKVTVDDLVAEFGVTAQSIRADLRTLEKSKKLLRFHGGARGIDGIINVEYEARRSMAAPQKVAIGRHAASIIPNNASLFINIGTTTEAVSDALKNHKGLLVVTNNINVANKLRSMPEIEVVIAGGVVRTADGGIVGDATVDFIHQYKVDYAIIGASAIDHDGALLDYDIREVKVAQAILNNARNVILVADSTKFQRNAPVRIGHLSQVDVFITDRADLKQIREICAQSDVELIVVDKK